MGVLSIVYYPWREAQVAAFGVVAVGHWGLDVRPVRLPARLSTAQHGNHLNHFHCIPFRMLIFPPSFHP